jgi:DNA-binding transcriptional MerR regulator
MTRASDIDAEFNNRVLLRGGLRLYRPADAIDLIRRCRDAGVRVLGIDAFLDRPSGLQPSMENSIDFSSERQIELLENNWQHAERFVREREPVSA